MLLMIQALRKVIKRMHYPLEVMLICVRWYAVDLADGRDVHRGRRRMEVPLPGR